MIEQLGSQPAIAQPATRDAPEKVRTAAKDFEALLVQQLLKAAREGQEGWFGTGEEDQAGLQAVELAEEQFARALSARGGLGMASLVVKGLEPKASNLPSQQLRDLPAPDSGPKGS